MKLALNQIQSLRLQFLKDLQIFGPLVREQQQHLVKFTMHINKANKINLVLII